jgi:hypothetical protein
MRSYGRSKLLGERGARLDSQTAIRKEKPRAASGERLDDLLRLHSRTTP